MQKLWIWITERQDAALRRYAAERGVNYAQAVRDALTGFFELEPETVERGRKYRSPEARVLEKAS